MQKLERLQPWRTELTMLSLSAFRWARASGESLNRERKGWGCRRRAHQRRRGDQFAGIWAGNDCSLVSRGGTSPVAALGFFRRQWRRYCRRTGGHEHEGSDETHRMKRKRWGKRRHAHQRRGSTEVAGF